IDHVLNSFPDEITEIIVIAKYLGFKIKKHLGKKFKNKTIIYVDGSDRGNAYSFLAAKDLIDADEKFLLAYGDELPQPQDVANCLKSGLSAIVFTPTKPRANGLISLNQDGSINRILEKSGQIQPSGLAIDGVMVLNSHIFDYQPQPNPAGEYYFTSLLNQFVADHRVTAIKSTGFIGDITTPADLKRVEKLFLARPLISVVIPYYRRPHLLHQTITSVLAQKDINLSQIEILICEHEPTKVAQELTQISPQIHHYHGLYQEGPGGNRQTGIHYAKGKYIVFLDADDLLTPTFLSQMSKNLELNSEAAAAVCLSSLLFAPNFPLRKRFRIILFVSLRNLGLLLGYLLNQGNIFPASFYFCQLSHMAFQTSVAKKLAFNYDYRRGGEDWDFVIQAQKFGPIKTMPRRLLLFRYALGSSTFTEENLKQKWKSYTLLTSRLSREFRQGIFYRLFLLYIKLFWKD
ncbi:MAG: glycosyltransferase, partial [Microgenomates group bacterium]